MQERLASCGEGKFPDMVLAANDNLAQGAIESLEEAGVVTMPVITGHDCQQPYLGPSCPVQPLHYDWLRGYPGIFLRNNGSDD